MRAFIFHRDMSPFPNSPNVGHVSWGFEMSDGKFCCGATENVCGLPQIDAPGNANAWYKILPDLPSMLREMSCSHFTNNNQYLDYKYINLDDVNEQAALQRAEENLTCGFSIIGNNCLDQACNVLVAYGMPWQNTFGQPNWGFPWKQTNPEPGGWFNAWVATGPYRVTG